jgi:uncharacterized protein YxeA
MDPHDQVSGVTPTLPSSSAQYPAPPVPTADQNPYDFIMKPPTKSAKLSIFAGGGVKKIFVIVLAIGFIIVLVGVLVTLLTSRGASTDSVKSLVQQQEELIRVSREVERKANTDTLKNLAYNIDLSVSSNQTQLIGWLTTHKVKLKDTELKLKHDATIDKQLANAHATSTYDTAAPAILADQLEQYLADTKTLFGQTSNKSLKKLLEKSFTAGKTLLTQARAIK